MQLNGESLKAEISMDLETLQWASVDNSIVINAVIDDFTYNIKHIAYYDRFVTVLFKRFDGVARLEIEFVDNIPLTTRYFKNTQTNNFSYIKFPLFIKENKC